MLKTGRPAQINAWINFFLIMLVFGIAHSQYPLYFLTQHQYFFHGLMKAGFGLLREDWLAKSPDSWPVFSLLVQVTYQELNERLFYFYYVIILGIYAYSLLGIADTLFGASRSRSRYLALFTLIVAMHSRVVGSLLRPLVGFNVVTALTEGVASQRILWAMLHPGAFGAFLLLSIHLFLRKKSFLSIVPLVVAAVVHPVYLLGAGALAISYMVVMVKRGEGFLRPLALGLCALILVLPIVVYMGAVIRPTTPEIWREAQGILVHYRLTRHADPARWLNKTAYLKIMMMTVSFFIIRRTELFWVVLVSFVIGAVLTIAQVITGSDSLALLYPWRVSVYLVPLASLVVLWAVLSRLLDEFDREFPRWQKMAAALSVVVLIGLMGAGAIQTVRHFRARDRVTGMSVMRFVQSTRTSGHTYLIPLNWRYFRLVTGAPALVEDRFIPYGDVAVVEWYKRVQLAQNFYAAEGDARCGLLQDISSVYRVTDVVLEKGDLTGCLGWKPLFSNGNLKLYERAQ